MKRLTLLLMIILVSGCSSLSKLSVDTEKKHYSILLTLHDTEREVYKVCGWGNIGCHRFVGGIHIVHAARDRCVIDHEMDHVFYGAFHAFGATCDVRAK